MSDKKELVVYAATWCPHCHRTVDFLTQKGIPFRYVDIEKAPEEVVNKIIEVNGGDDWVVPTIEYDGHWRPGKVFNESELTRDLRAMGVSI